ncbi:hypothetical protein [Flectobacillus roseus]|uniref:Uncharacterized protein n=1 Tax=Flectobacillus roseus TaxID=502259 RepID=A0ABT6YFW5_9BACT|nr:hypothetical protein [Flectobacillus roseus]MDI9861988.1 hypothetical protein [Flectobacillus roseus]
MTTEIYSALEKLEIWDADDNMDIDYVKSLPLFQFLDKIHSFDREILDFILYNTCQRVIPSWEFNCKDEELRPALFAMRQYLQKSLKKDNLEKYNIEIKSPKFDCTYTDTSGASRTLFHSVKSILHDSILFATYAISNADIANTNNFYKWFTEIAIPVSFDKKFCNCDQTKKYAYNEYDRLYDSLFIQLDSQT